jgi:carbonic anhydrase
MATVFLVFSSLADARIARPKEAPLRPENQTASEALAELTAGNKRYVAGEPTRPNSCAERRQEVAKGQRPFATILTCADSRVPPELIFDRGLGDLFVIRVAGNVSDDSTVVGSVEYASLHLGVNLVVVMGHQNCGAVGAAVANMDFDGEATHSHIDAIIAAIRPAVLEEKNAGDEDLLERSVRRNARLASDQLRASAPVLAGLAAEGLVIQPACYSLERGEVDWLAI